MVTRPPRRLRGGERVIPRMAASVGVPPPPVSFVESSSASNALRGEASCRRAGASEGRRRRSRRPSRRARSCGWRGGRTGAPRRCPTGRRVEVPGERVDRVAPLRVGRRADVAVRPHAAGAVLHDEHVDRRGARVRSVTARAVADAAVLVAERVPAVAAARVVARAPIREGVAVFAATRSQSHREGHEPRCECLHGTSKGTVGERDSKACKERARPSAPPGR